jgi:hypothetical protein
MICKWWIWNRRRRTDRNAISGTTSVFSCWMDWQLNRSTVQVRTPPPSRVTTTPAVYLYISYRRHKTIPMLQHAQDTLPLCEGVLTSQATGIQKGEPVTEHTPIIRPKSTANCMSSVILFNDVGLRLMAYITSNTDRQQGASELAGLVAVPRAAATELFACARHSYRSTHARKTKDLFLPRRDYST